MEKKESYKGMWLFVAGLFLLLIAVTFGEVMLEKYVYKTTAREADCQSYCSCCESVEEK